MLLDGTWNEDEVGENRTNILRLRDLIADCLDSPDAAAPDLKRPPGSKAEVGPRTFAGREYIVFYQRGVGTGPFDRIRGGGFGLGLDANIRRAYRFLSFYYEPGDEIFIFGFSRGAFTARSLAGFLGAIGLLRRETSNEARETLAWSFYRTPPNDRLPAIWSELEPYVHPRDALRVACLGVFDTVGALGIPLQGFNRLNRQNFEFHDVELSSLVDLALHALAIDEHRRPFEASVWRRNKFKRTSAIVEQVWFPGVHADIGGGYFNDAERDAAAMRPLDDLALDWMIKRLREHVADFPVTDPVWISPPERGELGPQHDSRTGTYKLWRSAVRSIGNRPLPPQLYGWRDVGVGSDPHAKVVNESVHLRAIERLGTQVKIDGHPALYAPANLASCLPELIWLYSDQGPQFAAADTLTVAAISGEPVQPRSPAAAHVLAELLAANERLEANAPDLMSRIRRPPGK
ncbi:MAG: DUF2235 domain-containing protein [Alphaproteobacteria bacterium]|nr:DUF2235 domain-containing protein [Alphaproteobacteria bacterium]